MVTKFLIRCSINEIFEMIKLKKYMVFSNTSYDSPTEDKTKIGL